jgi:hypothetical protein
MMVILSIGVNTVGAELVVVLVAFDGCCRSGLVGGDYDRIVDEEFPAAPGA